MPMRNFRDSVVLFLCGTTEIPSQPEKSPFIIQERTHKHVLCVPDKENKTRKRCRGCYEKLSLNENCKIARNKARRVTTFCDQCKGKPHLCRACFAEKHECA